MMNPKIEAAFNEHMNAEMYSSYLYLAMSASLDSKGLSGMASWMRIQAQEEMAHSMKFYDYIKERGAKIDLLAIEKPPADWASALAAYESTLEHEQHVTGLVNDLVDLTMAERDHAAYAFLQWFVSEQVEEEANVQDIVDKLKMIGDNGGAIFMIDKELGQRVFVAPAGA